ncbi:MAG TPA: hypothetical protein VFW03_27040, partial [Gemmatimonadaceae bacterium]|nr:hypothetical protein [Gemmatimonadaceae bacterium]
MIRSNTPQSGPVSVAHYALLEAAKDAAVAGHALLLARAAVEDPDINANHARATAALAGRAPSDIAQLVATLRAANASFALRPVATVQTPISVPFPALERVLELLVGRLAEEQVRRSPPKSPRPETEREFLVREKITLDADDPGPEEVDAAGKGIFAMPVCDVRSVSHGGTKTGGSMDITSAYFLDPVAGQLHRQESHALLDHTLNSISRDLTAAQRRKVERAERLLREVIDETGQDAVASDALTVRVLRGVVLALDEELGFPFASHTRFVRIITGRLMELSGLVQQRAGGRIRVNDAARDKRVARACDRYTARTG